MPAKVTLALLVLLALAPAGWSQLPHGLPYTPGLDVAAMDRSIDPCVDFYAYSCGGWMRRNRIPADQSSWSVYARLQEENRTLLRQILEAAARPDPRRSPVNQKIGDYYATCVDEKAIEAAGLAPLRSDLDRIAQVSDMDSLAATLAHLHAQDIYSFLGGSALFAFGSTQDAKNSSQQIGDLDQAGLGLPDRDYYLNTDAKSVRLRRQYVAHVQKMFSLLGEASPAAAAHARIVLRLETALAKVSQTRVERRDPYVTYHRMKVSDLAAMAPDFPWARYFAAAGVPRLKDLNVDAPDFIKALDAELKTVPLDDWKTYLRWHLVHSQARYLPAAFVNEDFDFYGRILTGQRKLQPRWNRCVRYVDRSLGEALGQAFVEKTFGPAQKARALTMVLQIEGAMGQDIQQLTWMSDATKRQALTKLHAVVNKIGYPDRWRDYSALKIVRGDALGNWERSNEFEFHRQLAKIGKPVDRGEWLITPPTVNAYYNPQMNDINFPAGVLQPPLFDPRMDDAPNYGDTGGTIGHELTHGFDDEGRQFDGKGNLRDWWTPEDSKNFDERAACIRDQYAQYTVVDDIKINSKLTLGEDVADLGGLLLAYMAWEQQSQGKELQPIDGLTPAQRFFIGYGQSWCSNQRPEVERMRATVDPHSPPKYRTNGVVSNMPEFRQAFHCKAGSPMVRVNPCRVW